MGKLLLIISISCLLFLGIGTYRNPNDVMFWLASGSQLFQIARGFLIFFLLVNLVTNPPRHVWFRLISGFAALAAGGWTIHQTYMFAMPLMDMLAFLTGSIILLVVALERRFVASELDAITEHYQITSEPTSTWTIGGVARAS